MSSAKTQSGEVEKKALASMSRDERSLLLYFETLCVDRRGVVEPERMNAEDIAIAKRWNAEGFCSFKRYTARTPVSHSPILTYLVDLSDEAWTLAHAERRARAKRMRAGAT